ncbi:terpenoid synthase [Suillus hirtellus]|nr:terpenoid synthase [Suillus hirtellus]
MAPIATSTITSSDFEPVGFFLPDLFNDCHYSLRMNPHSHYVSHTSEQWLFSEVHIMKPEIAKFRALHISDFIAFGYPNADVSHLRILSDFLNWVFMVDDYLDDHDINDVRGMHECCISALCNPINFQMEDPAGKICKSIFSHIKETAGPGCTKWFIHALDLFFIAAAKEAENRSKGLIHDLGSYTAPRRDLTRCRSCFVFIKYTAQIDLPDEVVLHPVIMAMEDAANNHVAFSNQSQHDIYTNLIMVLMHEQGLDLQGAVDYPGQLCKSAIQCFEDNCAILPSWGEEVDRQVAIYIQGLQDLSFSSAHYFGKDGQTVKQDRFIELLPKWPL